MATKSKLWTKDFIFLSISALFITLNFFMLITTTSVFVMDEYHASEQAAGLATGIFVIGSLLARLVTGKYIEMIGRRKMLSYGFLFLVIITLTYLFIHHLPLFIVIRFVHGFAYGIAHTVISIAAMDIIPNDRRGEGTSYFSLSFTFATAIGPFVGVFALQYTSMNFLFVLCTMLSLVSFVITLFAQIPEATLSKEQLEEMREFKLSTFFEKNAIPSSLVVGLMGFAYSASLSFLTAFAIDINLAFAASFFFIVSSLFTLISRPVTGKIFDVKGENTVVYPSILLYAVAYLILSQAYNGFFLLLAGALIGLSYGSLVSSCQAIAIRESPKHRVALASTTSLVLLNAGIGIGPFIQGIVLPYIGYRGMYLSLAVLIFSGTFLYHYIHGKNQPKRKEIEFSQASYKN